MKLLDDVYEQSVKDYASRTPNSQKAFEAAKQYMAGGETRSIVFFKPHPLSIERAEGAYLYDVDGHRYIDFLNNYTSMIHGHAHPAITEKVQSALSKGTCYGAAIPEQIELAEILCSRIPSMEKVRFCNSGTEAVLLAIRAAKGFTGKNAIIKMEGGFHGTIDLVQHSIAPPIQTQKPRVPIPDAVGISKNVTRDVFIAPYNDAEAVEEILKEKSDEIAAIILEPVLGQTGAIAGKPEYLRRLRELADEFGVLLIFDEIQTFRMGLGGVQGKYGIKPDLTTVGKFIGGGFPVAAFGGRADVMSLYDPQKSRYIAHSGTFNGNRVGMAAGIAAMQLLDEDALQKLEDLAEDLEKGINLAIEKFQLPISVARAGSIMHVHFVGELPIDYPSTKGPYNELTKVLHIKLLNRGIFIAPRGSINLSTVMTKDDMEETSRSFEEVLGEMADLF